MSILLPSPQIYKLSGTAKYFRGLHCLSLAHQNILCQFFWYQLLRTALSVSGIGYLNWNYRKCCDFEIFRSFSNHFGVSLLGKCPRPANSSNGTVTLLQASRTDTCSLANEGRNKHGPSEMGEKNEKSCRGNEQALAISFARLDADSTENDFTSYQKEQEAQDRKSTPQEKISQSPDFSPLQAKLDPEDYSYNELPRHTIGLAPWLTQRISMVKLFWMEFLASSSKLGAKFFWGRGWAEPLMSAWHAGPVLVLQDKSLDIILDQLVEIDLAVGFRCTDDYLVKHQQAGAWKQKLQAYAEQATRRLLPETEKAS
ncbi:hypothetical protein Peur_035059 [Populus x canadensis]